MERPGDTPSTNIPQTNISTADAAIALISLVGFGSIFNNKCRFHWHSGPLYGCEDMLGNQDKMVETLKVCMRKQSQKYNTGQLRYFDDNLSRTSKQPKIFFKNCTLILGTSHNLSWSGGWRGNCFLSQIISRPLLNSTHAF